MKRNKPTKYSMNRKKGEIFKGKALWNKTPENKSEYTNTSLKLESAVSSQCIDIKNTVSPCHGLAEPTDSEPVTLNTEDLDCDLGLWNSEHEIQKNEKFLGNTIYQNAKQIRIVSQ